MEDVSYIDQSGIFTLEDVLIDLCNKKITVLMVDVPKRSRYMLERMDIIPDLVKKENVFDNISDCLEWIKNNIKDNDIK